jgi:hypothetical protein
MGAKNRPTVAIHADQRLSFCASQSDDSAPTMSPIAIAAQRAGLAHRKVEGPLQEDVQERGQ